MQNFLNQYLQREDELLPVSHWRDQVNHVLQQYFKENNTSIEALTAPNKRELIQQFHETGIFKYEDSANYLANKLNVSRATVYNYLNQAMRLKSIVVHQVDSFTDEPFSGNPAGVVLDADLLDELFAEKNKLVALCLLCNETFSKKNQIHMRCFAPAVGIDEDPFTGSVLGGLSAYVLKNKIIDPKSKDMRVEQGHFMNRAGYVEVKLNKLQGQLKPLVIAKARHFFSTKIKL